MCSATHAARPCRLSVLLMCVPRAPSLQGKLLTVGQDGDGLRHLQLKGWSVHGLRPGASPVLVGASCRLLPNPPKAAAASSGASVEGSLSAVAMHCTDWPTVNVALGLSSGVVHTLRADVSKAKVTAPVPVATLRDGGGPGGITALHFLASSSSSSSSTGGGSSSAGAGATTGTAAATAAEHLHLFAVGSARLAAFDARTGHRVLDEECGAVRGCSAVSSGGELMLACPEAIYSYTGGWVAAGCWVVAAGGGCVPGCWLIGRWLGVGQVALVRLVGLLLGMWWLVRRLLSGRVAAGLGWLAGSGSGAALLHAPVLGTTHVPGRPAVQLPDFNKAGSDKAWSRLSRYA